MDRRRLVGWLGGLALVSGVVVVLRNEAVPPAPVEFTRFLADRVEHVDDTRPPGKPTDLALTALDRTSLRASWTATDGVGYGGFEVRWGDRTRLVQATETELPDLDADAEVAVEVRAVDGLGRRSEPAVAKAVPRLVHDGSWAARLVQPIDVFDGAEALDPRRWRVFDARNPDCLGLRPLNGSRLEVGCDILDLQSNVPLRLGEPQPDGAVGRVVFTTDGPSSVRPGDGELALALLPEPFQDLGHLSKPYPPGTLVLHITPYNANFEVGPGVPATSRELPGGGAFPTPTAGVRHRWEVRILPDGVIALRDGEVRASAAVAVPWTVARPRLVFRNIRHTQLDSFGVAGAPAGPLPASVWQLGVGTAQDESVVLGAVPAGRLAGGSSVRVVASVVAVDGNARDIPITAHLGDRSAPAVFMPSAEPADRVGAAVVYADFPLPGPAGEQGVRLSGPGKFLVDGSHVVVDDGQATTPRRLPQVTDRGLPEVTVPAATVSLVPDRGPADVFTPGGKARLAVELSADYVREVAAVKGIEVDLDGQRLVVLPTNGSVGGRHEFLVDLAGLGVGRHTVQARVVPVDERGRTTSADRSFEIRPV